jgi:hypothetical protein
MARSGYCSEASVHGCFLSTCYTHRQRRAHPHICSVSLQYDATSWTQRPCHCKYEQNSERLHTAGLYSGGAPFESHLACPNWRGLWCCSWSQSNAGTSNFLHGAESFLRILQSLNLGRIFLDRDGSCRVHTTRYCTLSWATWMQLILQ